MVTSSPFSKHQDTYVVSDALDEYAKHPEAIGFEKRTTSGQETTDKKKYNLCVSSIAQETRDKANGLCLSWSGMVIVNSKIMELATRKADALAEGEQPVFTDDELNLFEGLENAAVDCRMCLKRVCDSRHPNMPRSVAVKVLNNQVA